MQLHLRLELRLDLVQLGHHHFGRQRVVDVGQALDKLLLHLGVFQKLQENGVVDQLVAHALGLGVGLGTVKGRGEEAVIQVEDQPLPLLPLAGQAVEHRVTDVGVAEEHLNGQVIKVAVHVHPVQDVLKVLRPGAGRQGLDSVQQLPVFLVGALHRGVGRPQDRDLVCQLHIQAFPLGDAEAVLPLAHVVVAEVGTVDVDDDGLEGQVDDVRVQLVDQLGLKAVGKPRPHAVVAGVAEVEGFIKFKGPVAEEGVVKILFPIAGLGADLERLLRHIQGVVAAQGHLDAL